MRLTIYNVQHSDYGTVKCVGMFRIPFFFAWIIKVSFFSLQLKILEVKQMERYDFIVSQILKTLSSMFKILSFLVKEEVKK